MLLVLPPPPPPWLWEECRFRLEDLVEADEFVLLLARLLL